MLLVSSCICLCPIYWSQVLSREWRCSWSSADRPTKVHLILETWRYMLTLRHVQISALLVCVWGIRRCVTRKMASKIVWWFLCCYVGQEFEQTAEWSVKWDASLTPIWTHANAKQKTNCLPMYDRNLKLYSSHPMLQYIQTSVSTKHFKDIIQDQMRWERETNHIRMTKGNIKTRKTVAL